MCSLNYDTMPKTLIIKLYSCCGRQYCGVVFRFFGRNFGLGGVKQNRGVLSLHPCRSEGGSPLVKSLLTGGGGGPGPPPPRGSGVGGPVLKTRGYNPHPPLGGSAKNSGYVFNFKGVTDFISILLRSVMNFCDSDGIQLID